MHLNRLLVVLQPGVPCPFLSGGLDKRLPVPGILELIFSFAGAYLSILGIAALNRFVGEEKGILFLVGSFGASAVLLFGVTESKLAQPRNVGERPVDKNTDLENPCCALPI